MKDEIPIAIGRKMKDEIFTFLSDPFIFFYAIGKALLLFTNAIFQSFLN